MAGAFGTQNSCPKFPSSEIKELQLCFRDCLGGHLALLRGRVRGVQEVVRGLRADGGGRGADWEEVREHLNRFADS